MLVDTLIENARILTLDSRRPSVGALAMLGDRIVAVGEECAGLLVKHRINLDGAVVIPGLNGAYAHSVWFGHTLLEADLVSCRDLNDLYGRITDAARGLGPYEWVAAAGYNQMDTGGIYPDADALDCSADGRPVWIKHTSGTLAS